MKQLNFIGIIALLIVITASAARAQEESNIFIGNWNVDLGATFSNTTTTRQVDRTTVERTNTTTIGRGAKDMGILQINADGTYRLVYLEYELIYKKSEFTGEWREVPKDRIFGSLKTIELLDVVPDASRSEEMRKWYVIQKDDGSIEARYPPHDGYAKIKLTRGGKNGKTTKTAQTPKTTAGNQTPPTRTTTPGVDNTRTWTPDQIRSYLAGKTKEEVFQILGRPFKEGYGNFYFNHVDKIFPPCSNGCNYKSFVIQFGGAGGTVSSVELQYWLVE